MFCTPTGGKNLLKLFVWSVSARHESFFLTLCAFSKYGKPGELVSPRRLIVQVPSLIKVPPGDSIRAGDLQVIGNESDGTSEATLKTGDQRAKTWARFGGGDFRKPKPCLI